MKKNFVLLSFIILCFNFFAQENLFDKWQPVSTFSATTINNMQEYKTAITVGDKIITVMDTVSMGIFNYSGLFTYDVNTRTINPLTFTLAPGDRGITCATAYNTNTVGLSYGIFGCLSSPDAGASYPVVYTYNGQTGIITADSLTVGTWFNHDGGIKHIAMFSPSTNNDTLRVFSTFNLTTHVFKKHINQTGFMITSNLVPIENINCSFTYNNKLYVGGMHNGEAALLESSDGVNFTSVTGFVPSNFSPFSFVNKMDTLNGELYYTVSIDQAGFEIFKYNTSTHTSIYQHAGPDHIKDLKTHKNKLWYSSAKNESANVSSSIFYLTNGNNIQSAEQIGYQEVDGDKLSFAATNDSLYFLGNFGTFFAGKNSNIQSNIVSKNIMDVYLKVWKLNPPVSSFNYNNNQICLNSNETFTSTSQNTDSLHWLYDGAFYASSPGASAWMNINFPSTGNHSVGLVAFGGTLTDTTFLSVNVYSVSIAISGNTLVCLGNSFNYTSTTTGAIGTPTVVWRDNISSPLIDINTGATFSYSPTLGGTAFQFFAIVTDFHGCSVTSNTINAQCNPLYQIDGQALTGITPTITPVSGDVTLYKYEPFLGKFDSVSTTPIGVVGDFNFAMMPEGDYILKAVPSATILQTSYHGTNAISWKDATPFSHTCLNQSTKNIDVIALENIGTGPGVLTGSVYQGNGFGNRMANEGLKPMVPGTPIGGIIVKGGKNPGGQMFVQTVTAADGTYTLTGLPVNTGDTYFILVDIPGLDTSGTYRRILTTGTSTITGLDFVVDSIYIYPIGIATSVANDNSVFNHEIKLFPNPSKEIVFVEFELMESANTQIELFDIIGQKVKTISPNSKQEKNKYKYPINLGDLGSGIYFVKVKINNSENVIKLIITN